MVVIWKAKDWENSTMTFISLSQVFLCSMLLGVEIWGQKIGSSPFVLLRNAIDGPIFSRSNYLSLIQDGNGLNPLLQNYWMVIHPPTLFLGFAAMVIPFAYCMAGLWQKRLTEWMQPALPWALFALLVLGGGIIMGSFWAYEALNFGGFWGWDPVENASLFPWLVLIAAIHLIIVYQKTGHAYLTSVILTLLSFLLVLYATFLTRSGILGETSVHSFTDLGMSGQLLLYILFFLGLSIWLILKNRKQIPVSKQEEETYSREFWMFIGALILLVSCIQILATTSIPVVNAIVGSKLAPPTNPISHYNKWQTPFAILILILSGFTLHLKFKRTEPTKFHISIGIIIFISLLATAIISWITETYSNIGHLLLTFGCVFSVLANGKILNTAFKGKRKISGAAISHIGFAMLLLGAMVAASTNKVISVNMSGTDFGKDFEKNNKAKDNLLLYKNESTRMGKYTVTYLGDSTVPPNTFYKVRYQVFDEQNHLKESFILCPNAQVNPKMGLIASPDTRHQFWHDLYSHVSMVPLKKNNESHSNNDDERYEAPKTYLLTEGDTIHLANKYVVLKALNKSPRIENIEISSDDIAVGMVLEIFANQRTYNAQPIFLIRGNNTFNFGKTIEELGIKLSFTNILPTKNKLELTIRELKPSAKDYIVLKAIEFPYINFFWSGTIVMCIGFAISIYNRVKKNNTKPSIS